MQNSNASSPADKTVSLTGSGAARRNPVERFAVRGLIALLAVAALIEARAHFGYTNTLNAMNASLGDDQEELVSLADVRPQFSMWPAVTDGRTTRMTREVQLSWFSLFKRGQFEMTIQYSNDAEQQILDVWTRSAPEAEQVADFNVSGSGAASPTPMMGGFGGPGAGSSMQRPEPLTSSLDQDSDGEITAEELAQVGDVLSSLDTDGDGAISLEEFVARDQPRVEQASDSADASDRPDQPAETTEPMEPTEAAPSSDQSEATASPSSGEATDDSKPADDPKPADQPSPE